MKLVNWYLLNFRLIDKESGLLGFQLSTSREPGKPCIDGEGRIEELLDLLQLLNAIVKPEDTDKLLYLKATMPKEIDHE